MWRMIHCGSTLSPSILFGTALSIVLLFFRIARPFRFRLISKCFPIERIKGLHLNPDLR
jgi:hypothetical protein